jgi:hypothetical protein
VDFFNINNSAAVVALTSAVGGAYLVPQQILAPRIIRLAFTLNF